MALNKVILYGHICKDIDFRSTTSGISMCRFTVACDRQYPNKQTGERESDFIECQAWRNTAEFVNRYFCKGSPIIVEGSLRNNNYEDKNGVKRYSYVVTADNVSFGGSKRDNDESNAPAQTYSQAQAQPQSRPSPAPQRPQAAPALVIDVSEFKEVLSDEVPF